jgi:hypothetical protein
VYNGVMVGVSSFFPAAGCDSDFPDGFARVSSHAQWIKEVSGVDAVAAGRAFAAEWFLLLATLSALHVL